MNDNPLSPHDALQAAESARTAARTLAPPPWYAPTSLALFTGGVAVAGVASFTSASLRTIGGVAGISLLAIWVVLTLVMVWQWRRHGFIPRDAQPSGVFGLRPRARKAIAWPLIALSIAAAVLGLSGRDWALGVACLLSALSVLVTGVRRSPR